MSQLSTEYPRGTTASPRPASTDYPRGSRGVAATRLHGVSTWQPRRRRLYGLIIHVAPTASPRRVRRMYDRDAPQAVLLTDGGASSESVKTALKGAKLSTFKEVGGTARKRSVLERTTPAVQRCKIDRRRSSSVQVEIRDCGVSSLHGISTSRSRRRRDLSRRNPRRSRGVAATGLDGISTSRRRRRRDLSRRNIHVTASASARLVPTEYPLRRRDPYADSLAPRRSTSAATASSWGR